MKHYGHMVSIDPPEGIYDELCGKALEAYWRSAFRSGNRMPYADLWCEMYAHSLHDDEQYIIVRKDDPILAVYLIVGDDVVQVEQYPAAIDTIPLPSKREAVQ